MSSTCPASHGGNPWALLESPSADPSAVLDFSADLNPMGPPPALEPLLQEAISRAAWYPEPTYREFREAVARAEGVEPGCILPGNGTADLIHLLSRWRARRAAMVMTPTFTEYERAAAGDGSRVVPWQALEEDGFVHRLPDRLGPEMDGGLIFVCNPNNPTGVLWPRERLLELVDRAGQAGAIAVVDEAYMDFVEEGCRYSLAPTVARGRRLVVLRSLTKIFCVPGLRAGYLVGPAELVARLREIQPPWAMNAVAAFVGAGLLKQEEGRCSSQEKSRLSLFQQVSAWRSSLQEGLRALPGIRPHPSAANFLLCRVLRSNRWLADRLAEQGILIRVCDNFTGLAPGRFIRLAVRPPAESRRLLEALREIEHAG